MVELTDVMTYLLTELALVKGNRQKQIFFHFLFGGLWEVRFLMQMKFFPF